MSATWRRILKVFGVVAIGLVLIGVGFVLGRSSLGIANFAPNVRSRFGALGFGLGGGLSIVWISSFGRWSSACSCGW